MSRKCLAIAQIVIAALSLASASWAVSIRQEVTSATSKFRDLRATAVVVYANEKELKKMGKSFARSFEFKKAELEFKDPDKFRMEGSLGLVKIVYVTAGDTRVVRVPALHISRKEDMSDDPSRIQTGLDLGLVTDGLWSAYNVRLVDEEDTPAGKVYVLDLARNGDGRRNGKIWVDSKFRLLKREKYHNEGDLKARYIFKEHKLIDNVIWVPTRVETYSEKGVLVGISDTKNVKVNGGIADSRFK